jgi:intraflagellar transport protein 88
VDAIKASSHSLLASDLEINKAVMFLKQKELSQAADALRAFEKKETKVASAAATNLAFIHFLVSWDLGKAHSQTFSFNSQHNTLSHMFLSVM